MTSCTPGISSRVPCSTSPLFPVIPMAVRVAPGIGVSAITELFNFFANGAHLFFSGLRLHDN